MANVLDAVIPQLLAQGLMTLRQQVVMPRLINSGYSDMAGEQGSIIEIPLPPAMAAVAVTPAITPPANTDTTFSNNVQLSLNQWWEVPFYLTDKQIMEVMNGTRSMLADAAIKALAEKVNSQILSNYSAVWNYTGNAAAQPFASNYAYATAARKLLNAEAAPMTDRYMVVDPDGEESALNLASFTAADASGSDQGIVEGRIGRKLGFDWYMDQQVPSHTNTGSADWLTAAAASIGATSVAIDDGAGASGTADPAAGDVFTVAGDTQTYVVTSHNPTGDVLSFQPPVRTAWADNAAITFKATHRVNLAFNRFAFAFASRPLAQNIERPGAVIGSVTDPVSGLALRIEATGQHKQIRFSYDMLWGSVCVRPELAARVGALP